MAGIATRWPATGEAPLNSRRVLVALAWLLAVSVRAGVVVPLGGTGRSIAVDSVRRVFYVALSTSEVVVISADSPAVVARIPVPSVPGAMALDEAESLLYVAQGGDVGVVEVASGTYVDTIDLAPAASVASLALGGPSRLLALYADEFRLVDTSARVEIPGSRVGIIQMGVAATSRDGSRAYVMDVGVIPISVFAFDIDADVPCFVGEDICHGCLGRSGEELAVVPDGRLLAATDDAAGIMELAAGDMLGPVRNLLTGRYPVAISISTGSNEAHVGTSGPLASGGTLVTVDLASGCPRRVTRLSDAVAVRGVRSLSDGSVVAAIIASPLEGAVSLEVTNMNGLASNAGAVRARPLGADTGRPMKAALSCSTCSPVPSSGWKDLAEGEVGLGPLPPGTYDVSVTAPGYAAMSRTAVVIAGHWTDLGDVTLARSGARPRASDGWIPLDLVPGSTGDIEIRGHDFRDGVTLSGSPWAAVNSVSFVDWNRLTANITVSPAAPAGADSRMLQVRNPGDSLNADVFGVIADSCHDSVDRIPPAEARSFRVDETPGAADPFLFTWSAVTRDVSGNAETMGAYEIASSSDPRRVVGTLLATASTQQPFTPPADDAPLVFYLVRARDAAGNGGH